MLSVPQERPAPHAQALARIPVVARTAEVAGVDTRWWEYGPEDARGTILAVHGYRGDHHGIEPVIAYLPEYRTISPDLPGYGRSGPFAGRHTLAAYVDWLMAFSERIPGPFTILGHSFGSIVAAAALDAGLAPERVVLMNPIAGPALRGPKALGTLLAASWYRLAGVLPERAGRRALEARVMVDGMSALTTKTRDRELRQWIKEEHRRYFNGFTTTSSVIEGFDASVSDHVAAHAAAFTMPTLLIAARQDQIASIKAVRRLQAQIPGSDLVEFDGVGHLIHYERSREAADAIRGFIG
ncbi:MAG TPA: alpha/beta hydrolase [Microbacteriaceae bacterium]|nr:alpha/beta hydrolase [Microbacteriaceae bacterium]